MSAREVVVAIDGSKANAAAVQYAVAEAQQTGSSLVLVAVARDYSVMAPLQAMKAAENVEGKALKRAYKKIVKANPGLEVKRELWRGHPVDVLAERATAPSELVVGKRGLGAVSRIMVGSTSIAVAGRAQAPVVIVPAEWQRDEHAELPVLVAVDLDADVETDTMPVLEHAAREAVRRGVALHVIHVQDIDPAFPLEAAAFQPGSVRPREDAESELAELAHPLRELYPDLTIEVADVHGYPAAELGRAADDSQLLVIGRRRAGRFGFGIGSVARGVLHYADAPVVVVPLGSAGAAGD